MYLGLGSDLVMNQNFAEHAITSLEELEYIVGGLMLATSCINVSVAKKCFCIDTCFLFQNGVPHYEELVNKAAKLHSQLK